MDTYRSNRDNEQDFDGAYAYPANELPTQAQPKPNTGFGFNLLKALRMNAQAQNATEAGLVNPPTELERGAQFAGFVEAPKTYIEPTPVYRGQYDNLCPLYFNTEPVDNANDTRLERTKLTSYSRAQLFFLLRLERFLRLRHHWEKASPRNDETWKTNLVMRSIYSALQDCINHEVGQDARTLLGKWGCC